MDRDLNRSVRLLEDALSPHGRSLLRMNTPKPSKISRIFDYEELSEADSTLRDKAKQDEQYSIFKDVSTTSFMDKSLSGISTFTKPWESAINSLYTEFLEVIQSRSTEPQVFETVSDLARCCSETLNVVRSLKSKVKGYIADDEKWLKNEKNTWRLIYCLYQNRLGVDEEELDQYFGVSEKKCVESLYRREPLMRESQLIIDWLECNAFDEEEYLPKVQFYTDKTVGWENTLHELESAETIVFKASRKIISEMDPDAPIRQNLPLHDLDIEDEERLCKKLFVEIRCGKFEEAQKLCLHCGHAWRAALLEGWRLHHDPNAINTEDENVDKSIRLPIEGNENRDLWKNMAWEYCKQKNLNKYERATIAAFCGNLDTLLDVCTSWEDVLWAYMRTMVDIRVESEIRDYVKRPYQQLPNDYWDNRMSLDEIFVRLESFPSKKIREEAQEPDHIIQKYLILDQIPQLMQAIDHWLEMPNISAQFIRFLAHLVLFLRQIRNVHREDIAEKVLESYVKILIEKNDAPLIAYYTSTLGKQEQVDVYTIYCEKILDNKERQEVLQYAEDAGLDVKAITKNVTEKIINKPDEDISHLSTLQKFLSENDKAKISALDWVLFYPSQCAEAVYQSNTLISYFLVIGKLEAAKLAFAKIPLNFIDNILSSSDDVPDYIHKWIREHLSYKAYLDANEAFNDWFKYYHHSRPIKPSALNENASFPEKVAHEHKVSQYNAECDRWKITVSHLAKTAKTMLYNVLLFPDGGWLTGADNADHLRAYCIPETVLLLYSILSEMGELEECLQLADIVAAKRYGLYKVYSKSKLEDFLQKISEIAVKLLDQKSDMWL